jgi:hypothetical protein
MSPKRQAWRSRARARSRCSATSTTTASSTCSWAWRRFARPTARVPSYLFRNQGDGTFEDITAKAGVANLRMCKGASFGDYDDDGYLDIYVSNMGSYNRLYHNNR